MDVRHTHRITNSYIVYVIYLRTDRYADREERKMGKEGIFFKMGGTVNGTGGGVANMKGEEMKDNNQS